MNEMKWKKSHKKYEEIANIQFANTQFEIQFNINIQTQKEQKSNLK